MLEELMVFLAETAESARISIPPGDMGSKVASTCAHLVNTATYKTRKTSEGMWREAGSVKVSRGNWRACG